ncbi:MAG: AMIN domain-containing protein [Alphaproteobacteria bacterium]|nr:AMIN domain-containing protein [Alphaproteobacteria bacterium]
MLTQFWNNRKKFPIFFLLGSLAIALSGCSGWTWPEWATLDNDPFTFISEEKKSSTPPPPIVIPENSPDQNIEQLNLMPTSTMGLNLDTYFAQDIKDSETRMQRMENALIAIHKDLQNISLEIKQPYTAIHEPQQITSPVNYPVSQTITNASDLIPELPIQNYAAKSIGHNVNPGAQTTDQFSNNNHVFATGIRVGEHSDKIRIVFDISKKINFSVDLDNNENLLIIELSDAKWKAPNHARFPKMPLLESYKITQTGNNSMAVIQLKKESRILKQQQIPALSGSGKRIYIDLQK